MIRVVNRSNYGGVAYYVGRPGPLANPYTHVPNRYAKWKVATRNEAVEKYRDWLLEMLTMENETFQAFRELVETYRAFGGLVLSCWCAPLNCHANVIRDMIMREVEDNESGKTLQESKKQG